MGDFIQLSYNYRIHFSFVMKLNAYFSLTQFGHFSE